MFSQRNTAQREIIHLWIAYHRWQTAVFQKRELERVLTSISPDSLVVINRNRVITMSSGQVESMFGYKRKQLLGKTTDTLYFDRRVRGERGEIAKRLEKFGFHVGYATGKRRNGDTFPLEIITGTMQGQHGAVILMRDITERRHTKNALRESEKRFELFMRYLPGCAFIKDADGKAVYMNPYFERIYGWSISDCLGKRDEDLYPHDLAERFAKTDARVLRENRDIRYVARLYQQGVPRAMLTYKFPIPAQPDAGRSIIGGIALDITEQEDAETERRKIQAQMQQIIMNLVVNASDALEDKSGHIVVSTGVTHRTTADFTDIYLDAKLPEGQYVYLSVRDTGIGMSQATRDRIFDPFFTTKFTGHGLGLAAVMGIVRGHKGAVAVESNVGKGSTFTVYLAATHEKPTAKNTPTTKSETWRGRGTVLVADDETTVRNVAKMMLESIGFNVVGVANGREAVDMFSDDQPRFNVILLDLTMPELGGMEAYHEIRKIAPNIPIILSSGYNKQNEIEALPDASPPAFLKKPYRLDSMRAIFKATLETS